MAANANGQVVLNPAAAAPSAAVQAVQDYINSGGGSGTRRRTLQRRNTIAPDVGFTTFSTAIKAGWNAEFQSRKFRQAALAELVATAIFVAVGSACVVFSHDARELGGTFYPNGASVTAGAALPSSASGSVVSMGGNPVGYRLAAPFPMPRIFNISLVFGLMISILVFATGSISGGNINPAVSVSLALTGKMSALRAICYIVAQCAGATMGSAFIYSLAPDLFEAAGGAANSVAYGPTVSTWTALGAEITGTAILLTTVSAAADVGREKNNKYQGALTPLIIGLAVLVAHLFMIPIDGCSINPARTFGSAVVTRQFKDHWIFWVGPMIGGPFAAILYEFVFKLAPPPSQMSPAPVMIEATDDPATLTLPDRLEAGRVGASGESTASARGVVHSVGSVSDPTPVHSSAVARAIAEISVTSPPTAATPVPVGISASDLPRNPYGSDSEAVGGSPNGSSRMMRIMAMQGAAAQPQPVGYGGAAKSL